MRKKRTGHSVKTNPNKANFKRDLAKMGNHENFGQDVRDYFRIWTTFNVLHNLAQQESTH